MGSSNAEQPKAWQVSNHTATAVYMCSGAAPPWSLPALRSLPALLVLAVLSSPANSLTRHLIINWFTPWLHIRIYKQTPSFWEYTGQRLKTNADLIINSTAWFTKHSVCVCIITLGDRQHHLFSPLPVRSLCPVLCQCLIPSPLNLEWSFFLYWGSNIYLLQIFLC